MKARGKREAQRNASPLVRRKKFEQSTESAKYQPQLFRSFRASPSLPLSYQERRASRCSALAPGFHIPRLRRCHCSLVITSAAASPVVVRVLIRAVSLFTSRLSL